MFQYSIRQLNLTWSEVLVTFIYRALCYIINYYIIFFRRISRQILGAL